MPGSPNGICPRPSPGLARLARGYKSHLFDKPEGRPNPALRASGPDLLSLPTPRLAHPQRSAVCAPLQARRILTHPGTLHWIRIRLQSQPHLFPPPALQSAAPRPLRSQPPRRGSTNASSPPLPAYAGPRAGEGEVPAEGAGARPGGRGGVEAGPAADVSTWGGAGRRWKFLWDSTRPARREESSSRPALPRLSGSHYGLGVSV